MTDTDTDGIISLRDRKHLAQNGMIVVILNVSNERGRTVSDPDIIIRGCYYLKESDDMTRELKAIVITTLKDCADSAVIDIDALKSSIKTALSNHLYEKIKHRPIILPVITETVRDHAPSV